MSYLATFTKDPDAKLPYTFNWADWLGDDTITSSTWSVPVGINKDSDTKTPLTTTVRLSGGTIGQTYEVTNHIVTAGGSEDDRTLLIRVEAR